MSTAATATRQALFSARGITKPYGHVQALRAADLDIYPGEVVGLVNDNGAGKSTLVSILSGASQPSEGGLYSYKDSCN